jgi:hypothetical protein
MMMVSAIAGEALVNSVAAPRARELKASADLYQPERTGLIVWSIGLPQSIQINQKVIRFQNLSPVETRFSAPSSNIAFSASVRFILLGSNLD